MVDWSLARQVARLAAGTGQPDSAVAAELTRVTREMEEPVASYTSLRPAGAAPDPEVVSREDWAAINLGTLAELIDPVGERLDRRLAAAGPLAGALRIATSATLAAEAGLVIGYVATRVLGQYELSLLQPDSPARLLYVGANLRRTAHELEVHEQSFYGWIAIHELTHVFQFEGVPWLRAHLGGLLREYLRTVEVRIESGAAGGLPSLPNPARIVEAFRDGGLAALVQTREQRTLLAQIQAAMAVVEGYSDHVMDVLGARLLPEWDGLRDALERRRRSRSAPERVLERLLGLDLKLRQYELGRAFCGRVVDEAGIDALNRVWRSPEDLPTPAELEHPERWLARAGREPAPA